MTTESNKIAKSIDKHTENGYNNYGITLCISVIIYLKGVFYMTYIEFITEKINNFKAGTPIYTADLATLLAEAFALETTKANAATGVAMKRIFDRNHCPLLRFYQKGIYYMTAITPFGEVGIDKEQLIQNKYLAYNTGYETGYTALYQLGLTSQLPAERVIATNKAKECLRNDKNLGVFIRPPKTEITQDNKHYLQMLDALELLDKAPIDTEKPYALLYDYVTKRDLRYDKLLAIADRYYPKNTVIEIAHIANAGGAL